MAEQARPRWLKGSFPDILGRGGGNMTTPNFTADPDPATRGEIHRGLFRLLFPLPHLMIVENRSNASVLYVRVLHLLLGSSDVPFQGAVTAFM